MNELNEKTRQLLSSGRHNSAIRAILEAVHTSKGIERVRLKTQLQVLLRNDEVKLALDDEMRATLAGDDMLPGFELMPDKYHFTGKAAFPVFNESGCRIAMLNCEQRNHEKIMEFNASPELKGSFLSAVKIIQQYVQDNVTASEFEGNDVTVLNWGHFFSYFYNPVEDGIFKTENNDILEGDSFHFAALAAILSFVSQKPVDPGFIFTGSFEGPTKMNVIAKLREKCEIIRKERPSFKKIVIPERRYFKGSDREYVEANPDLFMEIHGFPDFVATVFGMKAEDLLRFDEFSRHTLGISRIIAYDEGEIELELYDKVGDQKVNIVTERFRVFNCKVTPVDKSVKYNVFPLPKIHIRQIVTGEPRPLILINHFAAVHNVGNIMFNNGQSQSVFAIGLSAPPKEAIIFAYKFPPRPGMVGKMFSMAGLN